MITVLIIDDHAAIRAGLTTLLQASPDITVIAEGIDGDDALPLVTTHHPDVVLMDVSMKHTDGIQATTQIINRWPDTRIIALTSFSDQQRVTAMLDAGACGYLLKEDEPADLLNGIRVAAAGQSPIAPRAAAALLRARAADRSPLTPLTDRSPLTTLTGREREVLALLATGLSNARIATHLGIREATVKAHLSRVYYALGVADRTTAALRARELNLPPTVNAVDLQAKL